MDELWVCSLGLCDYGEALSLQQRLAEARSAGLIGDVMLLLEHPAVVTRGRRAAEGDLPLPEAWYRERGVDIVDVNRGGKLTYHGPGQLVGYPIVGVSDVVDYVRRLEQALIAALFEQGVISRARVADGPDYTGVWVADRKIASIGVHVSRGVTTHGFALNVVNDLTPFSWFTACGLPTVAMTSVAAELEQEPDACGELMSCMRKRAGFFVAEALGRRQRLVSRARLERALDGVPAASVAVPAAAAPVADPAPAATSASAV